MYVDKNSLNLFMAEKRMNPYEVCRRAEISYETFRKLRNGKKGKPATIGKIAAALSVPVEKLIADCAESGD